VKKVSVIFIIFIASFSLMFGGCSSKPKENVYTFAVDGETGEQYRGTVSIYKSDGSHSTKSVSGKFEKGAVKYLVFNESAKSISATVQQQNKTSSTMKLYLLDKDENVIKSESSNTPYGSVSISSQ